MPTTTFLTEHIIDVEKGTELVERENETTAEEKWSLVFQCRVTGNVIRYSFNRETRDELVRRLTGGVVLHGGELPNLRPNPNQR